MCGRFTLYTERREIMRRFQVDLFNGSWSNSYNIAPTQDVLTIIYDGQKRRAGTLKWGLVPFWAKDKKFQSKMINARSESVNEKPSFKHLLGRKHCLIVADSFYEWRQSDKIPFRFQMKDKNLFAFAGLWEKWQQGDEVLFTCTMLTKEADHSMADIHHRMPLILSKQTENKWLEMSFETQNEILDFIDQHEQPEMARYEVSSYVNHVSNNNIDCIKAVKE